MRPGKKRRESAAAPKREQTRRPESRRETRPSSDAVAGRNPVVEALRAKIPPKSCWSPSALRSMSVCKRRCAWPRIKTC